MAEIEGRNAAEIMLDLKVCKVKFRHAVYQGIYTPPKEDDMISYNYHEMKEVHAILKDVINKVENCMRY